MGSSGGGAQSSTVRRGTGGRLLTAAVGLVTLAVVVLFSWRPAWSGDEAATLVVIRRPLHEVLRTTDVAPMVEPYYVLAKVWGTVSMSPVWLRLLSAVGVALACVVLYRFLSVVWSRTPALVSAVALAALPAITRYGQDARPYALTVFGATVVVALWWHAAATGRRATQAALAVALAVTVALHAYTLLIAAVVLVVSAVTPLDDDRRRELRRVVPPVALGLLLVTPYLSLFSNATGQPNPPSVSPRHVVEEVLRLPVALLSAPLAPEFSLVFLLTVGVGLVAGLRQQDVRRRLAVLSACWLGLPVAAMLAAQAVNGTPGVVARYWMFTTPALAVAFSLAVDALPVPRLGKVAALTAVGALAIPVHADLRGIDGHIGERWQVMPAVMRLPHLSRAPVLVLQAYPARALFAVEPTSPHRIPLAFYPPGRGLVNPKFRRANSVQYRSSILPVEVVIAYWEQPASPRAIPRPATFAAFRSFLRPFAPWVLCNYYGDALGIYVQGGRAAAPDAPGLARELRALSPGHIRCRGAAG